MPKFVEQPRLNVGAFYRCTQPGNFTDATTGITIPGARVRVEGVDRRVVGIDHMPAPVQIPTHKMSFTYVDKDEKRMAWIEKDFDAQDKLPLHEGLYLAVACGVIEELSDEYVHDRFPEAYAARQEKIVFDPRAGVRDERPLAELLEKFHVKVAAECAASRAVSETPNPIAPPPAERA